ncbi:hypothetical protein BpsS140_00025 [Bacillus phage vB_BpsS-140]|nr:hypothetical protein BpsS140_00025 [Bacillus phage vB_BpsS-140]
MLKFNAKLEIDGLADRLKKSGESAQRALDEQVLKDSNFYAPLDYGDLIASGDSNTTFGSGRVIWWTPYAARLYWNPQYNFSLDRNINAGGLWFEVAKSNRLQQWLQIVGKEY